jgi:hypothetical protein
VVPQALDEIKVVQVARFPQNVTSNLPKRC